MSASPSSSKSFETWTNTGKELLLIERRMLAARLTSWTPSVLMTQITIHVLRVSDFEGHERGFYSGQIRRGVSFSINPIYVVMNV